MWSLETLWNKRKTVSDLQTLKLNWVSKSIGGLSTCTSSETKADNPERQAHFCTVMWDQARGRENETEKSLNPETLVRSQWDTTEVRREECIAALGVVKSQGKQLPFWHTYKHWSERPVPLFSPCFNRPTSSPGIRLRPTKSFPSSTSPFLPWPNHNSKPNWNISRFITDVSSVFPSSGWFRRRKTILLTQATKERCFWCKTRSTGHLYHTWTISFLLHPYRKKRIKRTASMEYLGKDREWCFGGYPIKKVD